MPLPPQPNVKPPPPAAYTIEGLGPHTRMGKPRGILQARGAHYWVYRAGRGVWHIRASTKGMLHRFQGVVEAEPGTQIQRVLPTRLEFGDQLRRQGNRVVFTFDTMGGRDGFDVQLAGPGCLRLNLLINGREARGHVHVGREGRVAEGGFIRVCESR